MDAVETSIDARGSRGERFRRMEFEARIFFSLGIVVACCIAAAVVMPDDPSVAVELGVALGATATAAERAGYLVGALLLVPLSLLRIWAGSILTPGRVMAFGVQAETLMIAGPYRLCRNPIYLADFLIVTLLALYLPPIGLVMPALFLLHYDQIIRHEEVAMRRAHGARYEWYRRSVPRMFPTPSLLRDLPIMLREWVMTADGVRHNALYLLFIPGLLVAAWTGSFIHAIVIGAPAVIDWVVVHTRIGLPSATRRAKARGLRRNGVFDSVLYAQCWEDPEIDRAAFALRPGGTVLSITSGGDNVLAFLVDDPSRVIAVDLNRHQNDLLELKIAALASLGYSELLELCGVRPSRRRAELYRMLRPRLSAEAAAYWDARHKDIERGILHAGRYERYMRLIRRSLALLLGRRNLERLFVARDERERAHALAALDSWRWRLATRVLLSRRTMSLLFTPAFFVHLDEDFSFGAHFADVARRAFTELPVSRSPFLAYVLTGALHESCLPVWLRPENWLQVRGRVSRIEIVTGSCQEVFASLPARSIDAFNFSNIFEWMPAEEFESLLRQASRVAREGAVVTYRNLLVPRSRPESLRELLIPDRALAAELHRRDLSFIYRSYVVERFAAPVLS